MRSARTIGARLAGPFWRHGGRFYGAARPASYFNTGSLRRIRSPVVPEAVAAIALELGAFILFAISGLGLAAWLLDTGNRALLAFAPVLGLAVLGPLLVTAEWLVPARYAWPLPILVAALSAAAFALAIRRGVLSAVHLAELPWLGVVAAWGLAVAAAPYVKAGTAGPNNLQFMDAWFYVPLDRWLADHSLRDSVPAGFDQPTLAIVPAAHELHVRVGFDAVHSAFASLARVGPDITLSPTANAVFAIVPVVAYGVARGVSEFSRVDALGAAFLSSSTALLTLPFDAAVPNIAGVALVAATLAFGLPAVSGGPSRTVVATGLVFGGLVAYYSEYLPLLAVAAGLAAVGWTARRLRLLRVPTEFALTVARAAARAMAVVVIGVVVSPVATARTIDYVDTLRGLDYAAGFDRGLTVATFPGWLFGIIHLYEVPRSSLFSPEKLLIAIGIGSVLAVAAMIGTLRLPSTARDWTLVGAASSLVLAAWAQYRLEWNYGAHRSLVALVPFAAVALAAGLRGLRLEARRYGRGGQVLTVGIVLVIGVLVIRAERSLVEAQAHARTDFEAGLRDVAPLVRKTGARRAFIEGADAGYPGDPYFDVPAVMDRMAAAGVAPSFDASLNTFVVAGGLGRNPGQESYTPEYGAVVTRFGGIETARRAVGQAGPFAVFRRAAIDVALVGTGWAVDEDTAAADSVPWLREDFELWVSSPRSARADIRIRVEGVQASAIRFTAMLGDATPLRVIRRAEGQAVDLCLRTHLEAGVTRIVVTPTFAVPIVLVGGIRPDERPPPIDRQAAITALSARTPAAGCS